MPSLTDILTLVDAYSIALEGAGADRKVLINNIATRAKGGGVAIYIRNGIPCKVRLLTEIGSQIEYLFLDISSTNRKKILLGTVYKPNSNINFDPFICILEAIYVQSDDLYNIGDLYNNNNLLLDNALTGSMLSLYINPVNVSAPTHFHSNSSSLIDLVFVNNMSKVLLYDQISLSCFSNPDLLFLTYNLSTSPEDRHINYRDFKSIDFTTLNSSVDNICWDRIYSADNVNGLIQGNIRLEDGRGSEGTV